MLRLHCLFSSPLWAAQLHLQLSDAALQEEMEEDEMEEEKEKEEKEEEEPTFSEEEEKEAIEEVDTSNLETELLPPTAAVSSTSARVTSSSFAWMSRVRLALVWCAV